WQEGAGICCALRDSYPRFRRPGPELDTPASLRWPAEDLIDADSLGSGQGSFPFLGKFRGLGSARGKRLRKTSQFCVGDGGKNLDACQACQRRAYAQIAFPRRPRAAHHPARAGTLPLLTRVRSRKGLRRPAPRKQCKAVLRFEHARSRKGGRTSAGCSGSLGKGVRPLSLDPISPALLFPEYRSLSGSVVPALVRRDGTGAPCLSPGPEAVWTGRSTDRTSGISGGN